MDKETIDVLLQATCKKESLGLSQWIEAGLKLRTFQLFNLFHLSRTQEYLLLSWTYVWLHPRWQNRCILVDICQLCQLFNFYPMPQNDKKNVLINRDIRQNWKSKQIIRSTIILFLLVWSEIVELIGTKCVWRLIGLYLSIKACCWRAEKMWFKSVWIMHLEPATSIFHHIPWTVFVETTHCLL